MVILPKRGCLKIRQPLFYVFIGKNREKMKDYKTKICIFAKIKYSL